MKVKEAFSQDFFPPEEEKKTLSKSKGLRLIERVYYEKDIVYSTYCLTNLDKEIVLMKIDIPNPIGEKDVYKDIFLKYQTGVRNFMIKLFDVLVGEEKDIEPVYLSKQSQDLEYYQDDDGIVYLIIYNDKEKKIFGFVDFESEEKSLKVAKNFIYYFEGVPVEGSWREICEQ